MKLPMQDDPLDPGVVDVCAALQRAKFTTVYSCSGDPFDHPERAGEGTHPGQALRAHVARDTQRAFMSHGYVAISAASEVDMQRLQALVIMLPEDLDLQVSFGHLRRAGRICTISVDCEEADLEALSEAVQRGWSRWLSVIEELSARAWAT